MSWSLGDVSRQQTRHGDRPMITYGARTITWSGMDARASRVARRGSRGIRQWIPTGR